jgi:diguanylate cyclase (GGDEF)-like protein
MEESEWRSLSVQTSRLINLFVLRPQAESSKRFEKTLSNFHARLENDALTPDQFAHAAGDFETACSQFAVSQREDVEALIADLGEAVKDTMDKYSGSIDAAAHPVSQMDSIRQGLTEAQKAQSLDETRRLLAEGVASLKKLASEQLERERNLRAEYQAQAKKLTTRLQQAQQEGRTDSLTDLANRRAFEEYSDATYALAQQDGQSRTVAMMDLDGFKALNDTFGHAAGDAALQAFGKRLRKAIGDKPFIARLGGDEFVVISEITEPILAGLLEKLASTCHANPCFHEDRRLTIRFSFGISILDGTKPLPDVLKAADAALYAHKQAQKAKRAA